MKKNSFYISVAEFAAMAGMEYATARYQLLSHPELLPRAYKLSFKSKKYFLLTEVEEWLEKKKKMKSIRVEWPEQKRKMKEVMI